LQEVGFSHRKDFCSVLQISFLSRGNEFISII
jgi:hypothetical protein